MKKHLLEAQMQVALTYALVAIQIAENADHPRVTNPPESGLFRGLQPAPHTTDQNES
jgi:hypothetical protein